MLTEQDKADLLLIAEAICTRTPPYSAEAEEAYQRARNRLNIEKAVETYRAGAVNALLSGDDAPGLARYLLSD